MGGARPVGGLAAGPEGGASLAAAVRVTPSGRHVLVTNRGDDSIAVFRVAASGTLTPLGHAVVPGAAPRDLVIV